MFKGKRILFFSISFFGYQNEITNKLIELGAKVDYFDERPKNTFWYKALIRINKNLVKNRIDNYYQKIIDQIKDNRYDYVFFIKGEVVTPKILKILKENQSTAKFILYLWDSIDHRESVQQLFPFFNKILSFDLLDTRKNSALHFRPLFYLDAYKEIPLIKDNPKYDVTFIGTAHPDRYPVLIKVKQFCAVNNLKSFFFIYLQDWKVFYIWKIFSKAFKNAKKEDFEFESIGKDKVKKIMNESRCVLDVEKSNQSGLTMRTLEVLGSKRKLITTNTTIVDYDFFNERNILVIDRENPNIPHEFLINNYEDLDQKIYEKYDLNHWLYEVFQ